MTGYQPAKLARYADDVRFGSLADISALPSKTDIGTTLRYIVEVKLAVGDIRRDPPRLVLEIDIGET